MAAKQLCVGGKRPRSRRTDDDDDDDDDDPFLPPPLLPPTAKSFSCSSFERIALMRCGRSGWSQSGLADMYSASFS